MNTIKPAQAIEAPQPWRDWINGLRDDLADAQNECIGLRAEVVTMAQEAKHWHDRCDRLMAERAELVAALRAALACEQSHGQDWQPWAGNARALLARLKGGK